MKGAFGQEISDSWQAVADAMAALEAERKRLDGASWELDRDARDAAGILMKAIAANLRGRVLLTEVCPSLGMMHALVRAGFTKHRALVRVFFWALIGLCRLHPQLCRRRPVEFCGWNDFEMAGWTIAHDPYYTARIYKRLSTTRGMVQATCSWMVKSVREQEPDFDEQWRELLSAAMKGKP